MSIMPNLFSWENEEPYFINEQGFEWYIDKLTTEYARHETVSQKGLNVIVFLVVKNKDPQTYIIIDVATNTPIYENQNIEFIGAHLDMMKAHSNME